MPSSLPRRDPGVRDETLSLRIHLRDETLHSLYESYRTNPSVTTSALCVHVCAPKTHTTHPHNMLYAPKTIQPQLVSKR